jgi:ligand-binding sensor domain-containing protein/signal transduction histidine kinase
LQVTPALAVILWNDPGAKLIHENGSGADLLGGAVKRDDTANDTLYFKFHVDPLSDKDTEEYFAGFELYDGDTERLGIGNSLKAWAYSAFIHADDSVDPSEPAGPVDLHSAKPESTLANSYEYPRHGTGATIVFKVQYVPGEDDLVTAWLNPDLGPGANEADQPDRLTTRFNANATFDEIRLRHGGRGGGWIFSDLSIATAFSDFVDASSTRPNDITANAIGDLRALNFQSWKKDQGLTICPVDVLAQTRDGFIWVGGDDGLARFDGLRFVPLSQQDGFRSGRVTALLQDRAGALWIGSSDHGLSCWSDDKLTTLTTRDGLPANAITALANDGSGRLWIGTEAGLVLLRDGRLQDLPEAESFQGRTITSLFKDLQGGIWMTVNGFGVFHFDGQNLVQLPDDSVAELLKDAHTVLVDRAGRVWISAGDNMVLCREENQWQRYRIPRGRVQSYVNTLAEEADGSIWAGAGPAGLWHLRDGQAVASPPRAGLAGTCVAAMLTDNEGRLWVGTEAGLNRLRRKSLFALGQGEGLGFGAVRGLAEVTPSVIWAGKPNDGIYRWNGRNFGRLNAAGLSPQDSQISALLVSRDGFCWVATTNSLLVYKDSMAVADEVNVITSAPPGIVALAEDQNGALWVGTKQGHIRRLFENQWLEPGTFLITNPISSLLPAADGSMWVGTDGNGVFQFENGRIHHLGKREGLLSESVRTLFLDTRGALWLGTANYGLSRWQNSNIANFTPSQGLPNFPILQILEDGFGRLWLGTTHGILCINKNQLEGLADGKISAVRPKIFGQADGMLSEECSAEGFPACLKTKSGMLWFATLKGVVVVDPPAQPNIMSPPGTAMEDILVDGFSEPLAHPAFSILSGEITPSGRGAPASQTLRITSGKHRIEFRFTGLSFEAPEQIHFRYRLEGLDTDWVEAGTRRTAFYSYLPPGHYRFRVAACNSDGIWSDNGQAVDLIVLRHFYQTWWFLTLTGLSLMILVGATVRVVVRGKLQRRLRHLEQERALERERTRIARDLHDEMGAKLCRISYLSEHARRGEIPRQELDDQIASISEVSREVLHSLDEIVWAVNPKNDSLEHLASYLGQYAEEYFQMTGINCELDIPSPLPSYPLSSQVRHHLFMASHEALTNVLKHSGATQTKLSIAINGSNFMLNITDNGRGFDLAAIEAQLNSPAIPNGDGLTNMQRRLTDIGGQYRIESTPGNGTSITFVVPLNIQPQYTN